MKKKKRMLILLGIFAVLIIVYLALGSYNAKKAEKKAEKEKAETIKLTDFSSLTGISYKNSEQSMSFEKKDKKWYVKDNNDFPLSQTIPETLESTLKELTAERELKNADDLSDYGLKDPVTTFTLTAKGGKETTLYIGNAAGQSCYLTTGDKSKVYTVAGDILGDLPYDLNSMVQLDTFPTIGEDNLKSVEITENGKTTVYKSDDKKQKKAIATIQGGLGTFAFSSCANYNASGKDLKTYGLDKASRTTIKISYTDDDKKSQTITLYAGKADESGQSYYVQKDGSAMVNLVSKSAVDSITNKN